RSRRVRAVGPACSAASTTVRPQGYRAPWRNPVCSLVDSTARSSTLIRQPKCMKAIDDRSTDTPRRSNPEPVMSAPVQSVSASREVVDAAIDAYVRRREECADVHGAYQRWLGAEKGDYMLASSAYLAALDREEIAANVYADAMRRLTDECTDGPLAEP